MQNTRHRLFTTIVTICSLFAVATHVAASESCADLQTDSLALATARGHDSGIANNRPLDIEVSVEPLRAIEERVLRKPVTKGTWRHATLPEFYWAENSKLIERLNQAKQAHEQPPRDGYRALTLVAGAAGVGKSFLKNEVFKKDYPQAVVCKFDIRELYEDWARDGICGPKPDLASGHVALNHMQAIRPDRRSQLRQYLESKNASFFVIDSLDEIHPHDYCSTLRQLQQFVASRRAPFVHVAVFGRGAAFHEFWQNHERTGANGNVELIRLNPPRLRTTGDLTVSSWNYHTWKYGLSWAPGGGEPRKMPLDAYHRWVRSGFLREGEFRSITSKPNNSTRSDVHATLVEWATKHRIVTSTFDNLAGNSMMREIIERDVLAGRAYDERRIMSAYLEGWMARNTKSDNRPSVAKPENLALYVYLLQQVAVRYLHDRQVDQDGFFPVRDADKIVVEHKGQQLAFPVSDILDRSGLKYIDPRRRGLRRYRFAPVWIHRLLIEMHNEQCRKAA